MTWDLAFQDKILEIEAAFVDQPEKACSSFTRSDHFKIYENYLQKAGI